MCRAPLGSLIERISLDVVVSTSEQPIVTTLLISLKLLPLSVVEPRAKLGKTCSDLYQYSLLKVLYGLLFSVHYLLISCVPP